MALSHLIAPKAGIRTLLTTIAPTNFEAVADTTLEKKFTDTVLAHKPQIDDYSPLTDIHSQKMNLFLDEETAIFLEDIGIKVDGLRVGFVVIQS